MKLLLNVLDIKIYGVEDNSTIIQFFLAGFIICLFSIGIMIMVKNKLKKMDKLSINGIPTEGKIKKIERDSLHKCYHYWFTYCLQNGKEITSKLDEDLSVFSLKEDYTKKYTIYYDSEDPYKFELKMITPAKVFCRFAFLLAILIALLGLFVIGKGISYLF